MKKQPASYAEILFPELERELNANTHLMRNLRGYFVIHVLKQGKPFSTWYLVVNGPNTPVVCSRTKPKPATDMPTVSFTLEDKDLVNMASGGLNGIKAITEKKLQVQGDLQLAQQVETLFVKAGGKKRVMQYIRQHYGAQSAQRVAAKL